MRRHEEVMASELQIILQIILGCLFHFLLCAGCGGKHSVAPPVVAGQSGPLGRRTQDYLRRSEDQGSFKIKERLMNQSRASRLLCLALLFTTLLCLAAACLCGCGKPPVTPLRQVENLISGFPARRTHRGHRASRPAAPSHSRGRLSRLPPGRSRFFPTPGSHSRLLARTPITG